MWGRADDQRGSLAEMSDFFTNSFCENFKENSNLGWKGKMGGKNTEDAL